MHMKFIYGKVYRGNICKNVKNKRVGYNICMRMKLYVEKETYNEHGTNDIHNYNIRY